MIKYILLGIILVSSFNTFSQDSTAFDRPDIPGDLVVDLGFNLWLNNTTNFKPKFWPSKSISVYFMNRHGFSKYLSLYYGAGFSMDRYSMGDSLTLTTNLNDFKVIPLTQENVTKHKFAMTYVEIPLELRVHPLGTVLGEGFFIGVGGLIGTRISAHTKIKYKQINPNNPKQYSYVKEKVKGRFGTSDFRYGGVFKIGFKGISLYYKHYFSPIFDDSLEGKKPTAISFGISLMGF